VWVVSLLLLPFLSRAQAFEAEIRAFEKADSLSPPRQRQILFVGSSSIRYWDSLASYFPGKHVLQRGFGGAKLPDVLQYADRIIIPYRPKQIVLYAGENDAGTGIPAEQVLERFVALFEHIRQRLPRVPVVFIAIKSSPSRRAYFAQIDKANALIKAYLDKQPRTRFADIRPVMLTATGQLEGTLYKADSLHMRPIGYQRWSRVLRPYLK
jgi:lysophospholipase L1-like esterase